MLTQYEILTRAYGNTQHRYKIEIEVIDKLHKEGRDASASYHRAAKYYAEIKWLIQELKVLDDKGA